MARRFVAALLLFLLAFPLLPTMDVSAAAFTVTNISESGPGSLRQAIADSNATLPGVTNTITFDPAVYSVPQTLTLITGVLTLTRSVTITAPPARLTLNANGSGGVFSVGSGVTAMLSNLTITNGAASPGGGIANNGTLTVTDCTISNNTSGNGGGISNNTGSLTVTSSILSGNTASGSGGGIFNSSGTVSVTNSTLSGNSAGGTGGTGGGIFNGGTLTVTSSTLSSNTAPGNGGGIETTTSATTTVASSVVSGNSSGDTGGGIEKTGNGGMVTVTNTTITGNTAKRGGGFSSAGWFSVSNSTISGNTATTFEGGGIYNSCFLNPTINNSTISGNTAPGISISQGGGIYAQEGLTLNNTIVSGNTAHTGPNTATNSGRVINQNHSLIGGTPLLAPFGDYGSATILPGGGHLQTYALLPGSPAIDAGDAPTCAALPGGDLDQRGQARVGTCNIGAFESQGFTFSSPTGSGQSAVRSTAFAQPLTVTIAANNASEPVAGGVVTFTGPPTGASIQPVTVTATITSGIASASVTANGRAGPYTVTATASGVPSATPTTFTLTNFALITLTPASPLPGGTVGTPSTATFVATGGTNSGFTYAVTVGTPPPGLTLNAATGVLSGTPTTQGTSTFTVTATDDGTHTAAWHTT